MEALIPVIGGITQTCMHGSVHRQIDLPKHILSLLAMALLIGYTHSKGMSYISTTMIFLLPLVVSILLNRKRKLYTELSSLRMRIVELSNETAKLEKSSLKNELNRLGNDTDSPLNDINLYYYLLSNRISGIGKNIDCIANGLEEYQCKLKEYNEIKNQILGKKIIFL